MERQRGAGGGLDALGVGACVPDEAGSALVGALGVVGQKLTAATTRTPATAATAARISATRRLPPLSDVGESEVRARAVGGLRLSGGASDGGGSCRPSWPATASRGRATPAASAVGGASADFGTTRGLASHRLWRCLGPESRFSIVDAGRRGQGCFWPGTELILRGIRGFSGGALILPIRDLK